ncbi:type II secretion system secretin GspD [Thermodesulfobacteriota bacterium]
MKKFRKGPPRFLFVTLFVFIFLFIVPLSPSAARDVKEVALDFDDVDIRLFIRVISELTGKNFIINNNVRGKVTVLSPKKLTTAQAYEVFKSVLAVNGFTVVETGKVTKIVPVKLMSGYGLPLSTRKVIRGEDHFITHIMPLQYLDAKGLLPILKPLLSTQGSIFATPSSDLLIVTDYKTNLHKIDKLLDEIDIEVFDETIEMLDLKYSAPSDATSKITAILDAKYGKTRKGSRPVFYKIVPLERINALITVASSDIMMEVRSILSKIDRPTPEGKSRLHVYYLENAKAEDMVQVLTQTRMAMTSAKTVETTDVKKTLTKTEAGGTVVTGEFQALGEEVNITADKRTNSLIIYASPEVYNSIKGMIKKLDIPRKQVFIESLIMEISPDEEFAFGTEWQGFTDVGHIDNSRIGGFGASKNSGQLDSLISTNALSQGLSLGVLGESIAIGDFVFPNLSVLIRAVETLKTVDILSKPQLVTLNNEKATINVSQNLPFETSSTALEGGGSTQNIEYRDVGIILNITPYINQAGKIKLEIDQEVSSLTGVSATGDRPITRKRMIDTVVEVENGHTIVIGGLIEKQRDFSKGAMPCLGNIPFFGWAFKSAGFTENNTNLLIFISPRVIDTAEAADSLSREKLEFMEEKRRQLEEELKKEEPFFKEYESKRKREKQEQEAKDQTEMKEEKK